MNCAIDIGEDGSRLWRAVGYSEVPDLVERTFAWLYMAGLGSNKVAILSEAKLTKIIGRDICSSHLTRQVPFSSIKFSLLEKYSIVFCDSKRSGTAPHEAM